MNAATVTRKVKKKLRQHELGDLTVTTRWTPDGRWQTFVFDQPGVVTSAELVALFQDWPGRVSECESFISLTSPNQN